MVLGPGTDRVLEAAPDPGGNFSIMEDVIEKLKILNFEDNFLPRSVAPPPSTDEAGAAITACSCRALA